MNWCCYKKQILIPWPFKNTFIKLWGDFRRRQIYGICLYISNANSFTMFYTSTVLYAFIIKFILTFCHRFPPKSLLFQSPAMTGWTTPWQRETELGQDKTVVILTNMWPLLDRWFWDCICVVILCSGTPESFSLFQSKFPLIWHETKVSRSESDQLLCDELVCGSEIISKAISWHILYSSHVVCAIK